MSSVEQHFIYLVTWKNLVMNLCTVKMANFIESSWLLQFLNPCSLTHPSLKISVMWHIKC